MSNEDVAGLIIAWLAGAAVSFAVLFWVVRKAIVSGLRAHHVAQADGTLDAAVREAFRRDGKRVE